MRSMGVELVFGNARFMDGHTLVVGDQTIRGKNFLIATGAHSRQLPIEGLEHALTHVEAERLQTPPKGLAVIGGGIIAFEFAYIFTRLGTQVTMLVRGEQVLRHLDAEIRRAVVDHARGLGMSILTETVVRSITPQDDAYEIAVERNTGAEQFPTDLVLLAAGQVPTIDGLGLENAGVSCRDGGIVTDATLRTSPSHIWAAGDVRIGARQLSMVAMYEGKLAARNAVLGDPVPMDERIIPYLIGTSPPVASVGMTEEEVRSSGRAVGVHRQEFANVCSVAKVIGEPEGLIKVLFDAHSGELLGAHAFGAGAPELVQELAFAMHGRMTLRQAASAIVAFPGFSFALVELLKPRPDDPQ
jgi:pyruvate/2-oxoglutarate dehydrogenase complex dihydrolipoamide dehydrogenase (E3) component